MTHFVVVSQDVFSDYALAVQKVIQAMIEKYFEDTGNEHFVDGTPESVTFLQATEALVADARVIQNYQEH